MNPPLNPADYNVPADYHSTQHFDPAEAHIGPFFRRDEPGNVVVMAMRITAQHCNSMGGVHGGVLMTFADATLTEVAIAGGEPNEHCLTVSLDTQFIAGGKLGDLLEGEAQVIRHSRSLTFVRGLIHTQRDSARVDLLAFSGIGKRVLV